MVSDDDDGNDSFEAISNVPLLQLAALLIYLFINLFISQNKSIRFKNEIQLIQLNNNQETTTSTTTATSNYNTTLVRADNLIIVQEESPIQGDGSGGSDTIRLLYDTSSDTSSEGNTDTIQTNTNTNTNTNIMILITNMNSE
jgi:hypothetical protein